MKTCTVLLFLVCAAAPICADESTDPQADTVAALRSLEQRKFDAQRHENMAALDSMFDDGLMGVDENGALFAKAGYLENHRISTSAQLRIETMQVKVFDLSSDGVGNLREGRECGPVLSSSLPLH